MAATVITVENISKSFGNVRAVQNLSFSVEAGQCFGFLGPNGAGKTTAMKIIYGKCVRNNDGESRMDIFGYDPADNELAIKYLSGVVQQEDNLDDELNVIQNLMVYSRFYNMPVKAARQRIEYLLDFLELSEKANSKIKELSGGMKRRLVIARALLNFPRLLILDEPTTGLDPQVRHVIWDKIRQLQRQQTTVLLTTHYMEEAFQLCDRLLIMHKGRKVMEGRPGRLLEENMEKYVLEIRDSESAGQIGREALSSRVRVDPAPELTRCYCDDIDVLKDLAASHLKDGNFLIRQTNLEDVFLKATGRQLDDRQ
ncbi:MAG: ABC transporter [Planctomycetes bacterium RBG_16_55_9]|nr:MAG: ABC transporter [Planctomycetes bacterium RBG_16_55_9]